MLRTAFAGFAGAALLTAPAIAREPVIAPSPSVWAIEDEDTTVFLFGTVHILNPETNWESETVTQAFDSASVVYLEADAGPEAQLALVPVIQERGTLTGTTLTELLSEQGNADLDEVATRLGFPVAVLDRMQPWFAGINLAVGQIMAEGGDPTAGVDMVLSERAKEAGKELRYFETAEEQIMMLSSFELDDQVNQLEVSLRQLIEFPDFLKLLVNPYIAGDDQALADLLLAAFEEQPGVAEVLLYERNAAWAVELDRVMNEDEGVVFVAVGAGHLVGENSVQDYLAEKGWTAVKQ